MVWIVSNKPELEELFYDSLVLYMLKIAPFKRVWLYNFRLVIFWQIQISGISKIL